MLEQIRGPADLQHLSQSQLSDLAQEIREFLIHKVAATGGHLGPNLGVVELTLALHRVFDSPHDPIVFDTGHQAYVHKMLTGRSLDFDTLRKKGGLSGYPSRSESEHDWVESSHASSALSYADGMAKAFELSGHRNRHVVAVVGDGALTGGMCWEALNNIAASGRPAAARPSCMHAAIAWLERIASDPPRRMAALPDLRHSEAASAVTFGRDS